MDYTISSFFVIIIIMLNKKLQKFILKLTSKDQKLRRKAMKDMKNKKLARAVYNCDTKNILEIKKIIKKYGWPTFDIIGKKASNAFWLLVQHADRDIKFQKKCLSLLEKAAKNNQAHLKSVAYLEDRILAAEGKKQKFGTQFIFKGNKLVPKPTTNKRNLNKIRREFGLDNIETATKKINNEFTKILKKKKTKS